MTSLCVKKIHDNEQIKNTEIQQNKNKIIEETDSTLRNTYSKLKRGYGINKGC